MNGPADLADTRPPHPLRRHQLAALDRLAEAFETGRRRAWVVLPPGTGKTLVGLEAARRLGRPIVAFGPNTAIQGQWMAEWSRFTPSPVRATDDRDMPTPVTVLTYQALATFDPDAEVDEDGHGRRRHLDRLRPRGRMLVEALRGTGPVTLLLDECHHLLDTWGELVAELLDRLPEATVIGLTATPPDRLTAAEAELVRKLFGPPVVGPSIPAVVREGHLAPFAELAWLVTPTAAESQWLAAEAERFAELTTDLLDPAFTDSPFLGWLDERIVRRDLNGTILPWHRFERDRPEIAAAGLRFHFGGLLARPEGARIREEHRHPPTADDWVVLLGDYVTRCLRRSSSRADADALAAIRAALPSVGYQLGGNGIRGGRSPVDRVLARSEAKTQGVREILAAEHASLGERLRAVVLCDYERATATPPARLAGVLDEQAGSARLVLEELVADERTAVLDPVLLTGSTVAAAAPTARALVEFCTAHAPGVRLDPIEADVTGAVEVSGSWTGRQWVGLVTRFFAQGGSRTLIGTRALLGEGWDARGVNTLVDLTEATTATAVVQTRGRALRIDPEWPEKVANIWSVVCVADGHPKGAADWTRFVHKHDGYFGITDAGEIMAGVAHVHPELSPHAPPESAGFPRLNAVMLQRGADRDRTRRTWRVGTPYADRLVHTLRVTRREGRRLASDGGTAVAVPDLVPAAHGLSLRPGVPRPGRPRPVTGVAAALLGALTLPQVSPFLTVLTLAAGGLAVHGLVSAAGAGRLLSRAADADVDLRAIACATADALRETGVTPLGAEAVTVEVDETGRYRVDLEGVPPAASSAFVVALDEVLSPPADPRYLVPRYIVSPPPRTFLSATWRGARWLAGRPAPNAVVHHAVPSMLAGSRKSADLFAEAWSRWVSAGRARYARTPEGAGILAAQDGRSPLDVTTTLRVTWA
ncbi:DEAD/DEAH box helicase family protein [Planotetraspora kaengkrachanensis]|uniref:Helicase ATP-binding domain-containing protein n=1 Tax=Planotetraspora kaengkrachanensis TaxID=575193 RepID=A0A8J3VA87_9ACTN|nr:DEAD/DEAH box helicase family protein [Planotetraspora kaengkrachanensis]GIG83156.1 hypothetical protein Pka01_62830 [Planotetraspora kaengkrachanensis]